MRVRSDSGDDGPAVEEMILLSEREATLSLADQLVDTTSPS